MSAFDRVLLFDGTCNFCDGAVQFILNHERGSRLRFAALQSESAKALLGRLCTPHQAWQLCAGATGNGDPDTLVFVEDGHIYTHSSGALRLARHLRWPWRGTAVFVVVPRGIRDAVYRWFSRNRYRWFGKTAACRVPDTQLRSRFLE